MQQTKQQTKSSNKQSHIYVCIYTYSHKHILAQPMDPGSKSLNFIFPTQYVIPNSLNFNHWPSTCVYIYICCVYIYIYVHIAVHKHHSIIGAYHVKVYSTSPSTQRVEQHFPATIATIARDISIPFGA